LVAGLRQAQPAFKKRMPLLSGVELAVEGKLRIGELNLGELSSSKLKTFVKPPDFANKRHKTDILIQLFDYLTSKK
jgi:hypothetical protein